MERTQNGDPVDSSDAAGRYRRIIAGTAFWRGTTIAVALLAALVIWLDSLGGVFLPWMPPIMYLSLVITFAVALATFLRVRRMDRGDTE